MQTADIVIELWYVVDVVNGDVRRHVRVIHSKRFAVNRTHLDDVRVYFCNFMRP